ncbi:MAG: cysteine desulfurase [Firmicutes bacterium]|nr:cysteine desulfurase [Bacillota bacterium]
MLEVKIMYREDFPMLKQDIIYLDNGATSLKPQCVIDKVVDYYENYSANAHRGDYDISYKVDLEYENTRDLVKDFIGAKRKEEIVFTSGTTDALNLIVNGFFANYLEQGDEILLTKMEHASNIMPWFRVAGETGAIINYIPLDDNNFVTLENIKKSVTPNTKVISLAEITNVVGDIRPIKEICEFAHERDIFVVVDGAQSIPHKKCNVVDTDVDFLAFSAHKMLGPTGVGILYAKYELMQNIEPVNLGGGMNESFDTPEKMVLKEVPTRLEAGTPNIAGVIGLGEAIRYLNKVGMDKIEKQEKNLREYLIEKLIKIPHIDILNLESDSGIVAFNVEGIFSEDVAYYLNKYGICVRAGNHCAKLTKDILGVANSLRVSLYFYNTESEIDSLVELLKDKDKIMKEMF